jgi:hypothetical protein
MTLNQKLLDEALTKFNGDRNRAALELGETRAYVDRVILDSNFLRWKWSVGTTDDPKQSETLNRDGIDDVVKEKAVPDLTYEEQKLVEQMAKEDSMLSHGLMRLGLTPEETLRAVGMQRFGQSQFVQSVQIVSASMTTICVQLSSQLKAVMGRLDEVRERMKNHQGTPITRALMVDEEKYLMESLIGMSEQVRRMSDTAHRGMVLQASIRYKLRDRANNNKLSKPGFSTTLPVDV